MQAIPGWGHDNDPALAQKRFPKEFKFANACDSMSMHNSLVTYIGSPVTTIRFIDLHAYRLNCGSE